MATRCKHANFYLREHIAVHTTFFFRDGKPADIERGEVIGFHSEGMPTGEFDVTCEDCKRVWRIGPKQSMERLPLWAVAAWNEVKGYE